MNLQGKHVLVVEDETVLAMMLEELLCEAGALVVGPASTVDAALALIAARRIDVVLLDVSLHNERSDRVAEMLRQHGVPYVLATGYTNPRDTPPAVAPVLHKPYRFTQVEAALIAAIQASPSRT